MKETTDILKEINAKAKTYPKHEFDINALLKIKTDPVFEPEIIAKEVTEEIN
jgi:hypothetical protein